MRAFVPPRSATADRKSASRPRGPIVGSRPARASRHLSGGADARRETLASPAPSLPATDGLPAGLQSVMEAMSGFSLADVVVHRNSTEPSRLGAAAFAQGNQIHVAPGQERHLPHEAWHVVQQKQGRVAAALQMKRDVAADGDIALEREADMMGKAATEGREDPTGSSAGPASAGPTSISHETLAQAPDKTPDGRAKVGVSEQVKFTIGRKANWSASSGAPASLAAASEFIWTAPESAEDVTVKAVTSIFGKSYASDIEVVLPSGIGIKKAVAIPYPSTEAGVAAKLRFSFPPNNVSFSNCEWREEPGPATNVTGYFLQLRHHIPPKSLNHKPSEKWKPISPSNTFSFDTVATTEEALPRPWDKGSFQWIIPNTVRKLNGAGSGVEFATTTQTFSLAPDGTATISKTGNAGGDSVSRKP